MKIIGRWIKIWKTVFSLALESIAPARFGIGRLAILVGLTVGFGVLPATAQQDYEIVDLGSLGGSQAAAQAINDAGQITGFAELPTSDGIVLRHAFVWLPVPAAGLPSGLTELGPSDLYGSGFDIGPGPIVVGRLLDLDRFVSNPFRWRDGVIDDLGGLPAALTFGVARGLNRQGDVVGTVSNGFACYPSIWLDQARYGFPAGRSELTPVLGFAEGFARDINDRGEVVGGLDQICDALGDLQHAFIWLPEPAYGLPAGGTNLTPELSTDYLAEATAINDIGQVVGFVIDLFTLETWEGFLWQDGVRVTLPPIAIDVRTEARDINDHGVAVGISGDRAVRWQDGSVLDLNTLLPAGEGDDWVLTAANAINNQGQIVGTGTRDGIERPFLLNPPGLGVAIPTTGALGALALALLLGLVGVVALRR